MALSDDLLSLSLQAKTLESAATEVNAKNEAKILARIAELQRSLEAQKIKVGDEMIGAGDEAALGWATMQQNASNEFDSLRARGAARRADRKAKHAENVAEGSEADAADAVSFAIYAIQEAEYSLLQAAVDRETADGLAS